MQDAAAEAHRQYKFLFVYLHSGQHEATQRFCSETLCAPELVAHIGQHFVAWAGDVRRSDAFGVRTKTVTHQIVWINSHIPCTLNRKVVINRSVYLGVSKAEINRLTRDGGKERPTS